MLNKLTYQKSKNISKIMFHANNRVQFIFKTIHVIKVKPIDKLGLDLFLIEVYCVTFELLLPCGSY